MDKPVLTDRSQIPTQKIVFSCLGKNKDLWIAAFDCMSTEYPELSKEWRYYNDGKSWLMKVSRKKSTIFWLSVVEKTFRTTFYFSDKFSQAIEESSLSESLKQKYREGNQAGKIRGITIVWGKKKDLEDFRILIDIKLSIK